MAKTTSKWIQSDLALSGNPTTSTQAAGNNSTRIATTAYADNASSTAAAGVQGNLAGHLADHGNPHQVTKAQVLSGNLIVNADVDAAAAIAESKLALDHSTASLYAAIGSDAGSISALQSEMNHMVNLSGVAVNSDNFGSFVGTVLSASESMKTALQSLETAVDSKLSKSGGIMSGQIDMGNQKIINLLTPNNDNDAATKHYVDTVLVTGSRVKEAVLVSEQLSNSQGILAAEIFDADAQPVPGDTLVITNGTNTETYTFRAAHSAPFDVEIGITLYNTYANLAAEINTNSAHWSAKDDSVLTALDPEDADGVVVIYEKTTAAGASTSRLYGVWATQANAQTVPFNGDIEYSTSKTEVQLPSSDPAAGRFGLRKQISALVDGEIHVSLDDDSLSSWNASLSAWVTLSANSIPDATSASGGATHGKVTADSDKGLVINSGVLTVKVDNSSVDFNVGGQLEVKANGITSGMLAGNVALDKLAALTNHNRVLVSDNSGVIAESSITSATLGYLDATSSIQTQINASNAAIGSDSAKIGHLETLSGVTSGSNNLGAFTGPYLASSESNKSALQKLSDAIVTASGAINFAKEILTISSADIALGYKNLANIVHANSLNVTPVGGPLQTQGVDYSLSTVALVTRVTFAGDLATTLADGDLVEFKYEY